MTGLEPVRRSTHAPQTCLSTSSSTLAFCSHRVASLSATRIIISMWTPNVNTFFQIFLKWFCPMTNTGFYAIMVSRKAMRAQKGGKIPRGNGVKVSGRDRCCNGKKNVPMSHWRFCPASGQKSWEGGAEIPKPEDRFAHRLILRGPRRRAMPEKQINKIREKQT